MPKETLLKQYRLCKHCLERHASTGRSSKPCYICRGLMDNLGVIANSIVAAVECFEFDTFLIGATLSTQLYEREDAMRARLKIRGRESIKHNLTRELGIRIAKLARKEVEYTKPDIMITLTVDKENNVDVTVISRPLVFAGVYIKKSRGLPQKQGKCANCGGKGCDSCNYSGQSGYDSVEGVISREMMRITGGQTPKFTWMGSEDPSSLVLGSGRPFYMRIFNPKKRKIKNKTIKGNGIKATLNLINNVSIVQPRFTVKSKVHIKCENALTKQILKKLNSLSGSVVSFENRSKKGGLKSIYSVRVRQVDSNHFTLTTVADGGLMIKQLVGGEEYMKPNISEILGSKCECIMFDIMDVQLQ
ncbi:MAG TPA: tRNA pseudouridine(54/55) synthase Pus10 [Nitrososphaera sp.]|nr:tRNA pseudouridine(54/55) synthase Pus10 [Nitrososphaera sp.]